VRVEKVLQRLTWKEKKEEKEREPEEKKESEMA